VIIRVEANAYKECDAFSRAMWANSKVGNEYNRGILNTKEDPYKTERVGALGEMAFSLFMGAPVDFEYSKFGKEVDFTINGKTIDVKTAAEKSKYSISLLRATTDRGNPVKISCDVYVSAYIIEENIGTSAQVALVGWHLLPEILEQKQLPARRKFSRHKNYELKYEDSHPMESLRDYLNA
jgi:hypothetical protein